MEPEDFSTLLELGRNPGEEGHPEDLFDRISTSYDHATTTRDSAVGELTSQLAEQTALVTTLQAHNYRLMMQLAGDKVDEPTVEPDNDGDTNSGDTSGESSIWTVKE